MGFNITKKEPGVTAICVHLQNERTFRQYRRNAGSNTLSSLDHYFLRPLGTFNHDGMTRFFANLTYVEYNTLFRLQKFDVRRAHEHNFYVEQENRDDSSPMHVILRGSQRRHYARIRDVPNAHGELFYFRALLQNRPSSSFRDARTIDGVEYHTFQEAATALGLFADENEAEYALWEGIRALKTPKQLRFLFVHLLVNDCILTPLLYWDTFQVHLCHDFILRHPDTADLAIQHGLEHISQLLEEHGKQPSDYDLPQPVFFGREVEHEMLKWAPFSVELSMHAHAAYDIFNLEQKLIYDNILTAVESGKPLLLFLDGKAGVGKSFLVNALCARLRSQKRIVLPTATSAFAAQLYPGGRTLHSTFKVTAQTRRHSIPLICIFRFL